MESETVPAVLPLNLHKYSNRVILKTILDRDDGGLGLIGQRVVIGGWVKSSKEFKKERPAVAAPADGDGVGDTGPKDKDVTCVEILQSRIPFIRSLIKALGRSHSPAASRDKLEPAVVVPKPPLPSISILQVSDGSCVATLQVLIESSLAPPSKVLPTGTCILVDGELTQSSLQGKQVIEVKVEKVLHIGTVDSEKYPLSKKRLPLNMLRDCSHFRPRTTTVASVMRIRSGLDFTTHRFFENHGFLSVEVPIMTITDCEGFSEKFQVSTLFNKADKKGEPGAAENVGGVSLDVIKAAAREKSNIVEELKRTESNREALAAAIRDLQKTNELAAQLEARENLKSKNSIKDDKSKLPEDFFPRSTYLTVSGRLHLESYACSLGNVYSFGPRFRANRAESQRNVAEMWTVDMEMAFSELKDAMSCADDFFIFLCKSVLENCSEDMKFVIKRMDNASINRLKSVISTSSSERISYTEALDVLKKVTDKSFETKLEWGTALTTEHLSYLADEMYKRPVIVYNHPKEVKPFYVRLNDDGRTVASFDMVVPKVGTLISGSQNEERFNVLSARIKELGLAGEQYEWYLDLRRHGTVKHSGFSFSFDLMVLFTTGLTDVRDVIPFPRSYGKAAN
ncbi:asparagine--tRNA ligase, cytoplasmic 2 [Ziziphus jujuba]|uniref:Asparagine--tRNA ligase, cytoplasmic 2 n=1 Tax=Ziziphus jujuba TaxID=326968 RepID=A0A6P4B2D3_ZIZJJ|nr:asparagine--tRNA ligase, cytoplasmic 2 [Ziziphus jujuba]